MSENVSGSTLSANQIQAAQMLADGSFTVAEIAEQIGVKDRTIYRWQKDPEFQATLNRHRDVLEAVILQEGIARKAQRIKRYAERLAKLDRVIEERGSDWRMADTPGGTTGLIVRQLKSIGVGAHNREVEEFVVDTGLLREIRELEKQAAQELGQWIDKGELTGRDGGAIQIDDVGLSDDERAERIAAILDRARARGARSAADNG